MRKTGIVLLKLTIVVGLLAGVYQCMEVFNKVVSPDPAVELAFRSASVDSPNGNHQMKEDAKSFFDKQQKRRQSEASKKLENSEVSAMQTQRSEDNRNLAMNNDQALNRVSGKQSDNLVAGMNMRADRSKLKPSQVSQTVNAKSGVNQAPVSQSSVAAKSSQRVGGSPGEPLVTGSLPLGNGLAFLLLLCMGYALRIFLYKI